MISYIIVTRNPTSKKLIVIEDGTVTGSSSIAEFSTEEKAYEVAYFSSICRAWGCEIIPVDRD